MKVAVRREIFYPELLFKRLLLILLLHEIARVFFYFTNKYLFPEVGFTGLLKCLFFGIRFDLCAIAYTNLLFIILHIIPSAIRDKRWYQVICKVLFYLVNFPVFLLMLADAEYYRFSLRHGTIELLDFAKDFLHLLPSYLLNYWYIIPAVLLITIPIELLYRRTSKTKTTSGVTPAPVKRNIYIQLVLFPLLVGLTFLMMRGGFQRYPLAPIHASKYVPQSWTPIVTNTPLTILYSVFRAEIKPLHYLSDKEVAENFEFLKQPVQDSLIPSSTGKPENIFIIILESFSSEYTGKYLGEKTATPFFDSLCKEGMYFENMHANAMRSIEGIPAILAGIPNTMDESFLTSVYQSNNYKGMGTYLNKSGYSSAFFHGGPNGTFNLDNFAYAAGFQKYFGKNEFKGTEEDYCSWGIYDEPFFQYTASEVNKLSSPFVAAMFSLSSHHPYEVPESYAKQFPQQKDKILNSVQYADHSLREFFNKIKNEPWFSNTLFIITADHCGASVSENAAREINRLHIPLLLYHPSNPIFKGDVKTAVQQIDILPTVLDYLRYPEPYTSFGNGVFRSGEHYSCLYVYGSHYITDGKYVVEMNEGIITGVYELNAARDFAINSIGQHPDIAEKMGKRLKAFLQFYTNALLENKMN